MNIAKTLTILNCSDAWRDHIMSQDDPWHEEKSEINDGMSTGTYIKRFITGMLTGHD